MSEHTADNMLESPLHHHRMNHHGSNNGGSLLLEQSDELSQLAANLQTTNDDETPNDLNSINIQPVTTTTASTSNATSTRASTASASTTATMAAQATANAIAVARAAAAAAAAVQSAMNSVANNSSAMNSNTKQASHQHSTTSTRRHTNAKDTANVNANSVQSTNLTNNITNDGTHLNAGRSHKSRDSHQQALHSQQQQQLHNSCTTDGQHENDNDMTSIIVGDVIIGEENGDGVREGDEGGIIIGHATATQGEGEEDEFQLHLHHHHHNILVHENEIEIGNVVEHEAMQHGDEVIIGGAHPIVIKTEAGGDHDGTTVTLVSADGMQQQQLHHITVSGRENDVSELHGHGQDGSGSGSRHHQQHGGNIIAIPVVGSMPYTVLNDSDPNGIVIARSQNSLVQDSLNAVVSRGSGSQASQQTARLINTTTAVTTNSSSSSSSLFCNSHLTWEEAVSAPILPVRCKDTNAELYKNKFGSGNKGKCIKAGIEWFTPTEFEALCGRGNSKDWKRSIRFGGRTLQTLIDKGFLVPHASSCICSNCVDDATATGPIRPFTPYQRKRKTQSGDNLTKPIKLERLTSKDSNTDESSDVCTPGTSGLVTGSLNTLSQAMLKVNQTSLPASNDEAWKVLEEGVDRIVTAAANLKNMVLEMKERTTQEAEELRSQLQSTFQGAVQSPVVGHPQILRIFDNNRIQTYSIEVLDPDSFTPMQTNSTTITKCDNCGREGSLECSGCHTVHYCSSFCQKKDWPTHQAACQDRGHQHQLKEEIL